MKILTAEDTPSIRDEVSHALRAAGFEVIAMEDGLQALAWAQTHPPVDLVLSDVNMPHLDGIDLVRSLRSIAVYQQVPVIMLTTESSPYRKQEAKLAGATAWVTKPFEATKVIALIRALVF